MESLSIIDEVKDRAVGPNESITIKSDVSTRIYLPKSLFKHRPKKHGLDTNDLKNLPSSSAETPDDHFKKFSMTPVKE
tara:strand:- start:365 stop:598 length:234 start_codon:yes stop_codon:yes gene_type:complete